ncbi:Hus1-like protein-domain-containing protein [Thermothelomyces heterothallicus CBS 202.75]|uniref:Hus1-like protein-domain-containing protein n=1 Tax=Thermothelomyces heterothallicus CBS 202.75 TaxID=1149848 RepID=UPI0037433E60
MSDTSGPLFQRPSLSIVHHLFRVPLLPAIAAKHVVTFALTTLVAFAMGRTVRGRSDVKRHLNPSTSEKQHSAIQIEDRICLICQEIVGTRNVEGIKEGFSMLPCGHRFGSYCIKRYLGLTADEEPLCPICRHVAYHDACGHPVLPFLLKSDGTHPDLITDESGKVRPPNSSAEALAAPCEYCRLPQEQAERTVGKLAARLSSIRKPLRWLRDMVPFAPKWRLRLLLAGSEDSSEAEERPSSTGERPLTRQEIRSRRRTPVNNGVWEGPWVDVQTRDVEWEKWWMAQSPRGYWEGGVAGQSCHECPSKVPRIGAGIAGGRISHRHDRRLQINKMRFKTDLKNVRTFSKLTAALNSLEKIAWVRLDDDTVRFTVIPDTGSQVWASLSVDLIFDNYHIQSAEVNNTINLELPLGPLQRALKSAIGSSYANLRLTKRDGIPMLSMTIHTMTKDSVHDARGFGGGIPGAAAAGAGAGAGAGGGRHQDGDPFADPDVFAQESLELTMKREREKIITQDIPVRVLHPDTVETIMQPKVREPDVHIQLPPLLQLKAISDRFTKLALTASSSSSSSHGTATRGGGGAAASNPKLTLSANMHGSLRLRLATDTLDITSVWNGLENPELDPAQLAVPLEEHPSTRFREAGPDKWATVRVDGRDWSRVLSVGRLEGRVIACFADDHALILYVYVPHADDIGAEDVVTYYVSSYSA